MENEALWFERRSQKQIGTKLIHLIFKTADQGLAAHTVQYYKVLLL
jgi:hypothetical protein